MNLKTTILSGLVFVVALMFECPTTSRQKGGKHLLGDKDQIEREDSWRCDIDKNYRTSLQHKTRPKEQQRENHNLSFYESPKQEVLIAIYTSGQPYL